MADQTAQRDDWANEPEPAAADWASKLPPKYIDGGRPNPAYFQARLERLNLIAEGAMGPGSELPGGYNQLQKGILHEAKLLGLSERDVLDNRSEASKIADAIDRLLEAPAEFMTLTEDEITGVERAMAEAEKRVSEVIQRREVKGQFGRQHGTNKWRHEGKARLGQWQSLFKRLKKLRTRAIKQMPGQTPGNPNEALTIRAAHLLRFMAFVQRSNIKAFQTDKPSDTCLKFGSHHGDMALDIYLVENQLAMIGEGRTGKTSYDGLLMTLPPGHGKTEVGVGWATLRICHNPTSCGLVTHAQAPKAKEILAYIASNFDRSKINGRRCMALFPLQLADRDNNSGKLRIQNDVVIKAPTVEAAGILGKVSGSSVDWILFDDTVDQEIVDQPETRRRVFDRINGTFLRRLRGKSGTMHLTICTLWHHDDPNARRIAMARSKQSNTKVLIRRCGGPDSKPAFSSIWPEVYDAAYLRQTYNSMRNPSLYAAQFQCDPRPESMRMIRRLRYYDPKAPDHAQFIASSIRRLSLDPAATEHQRSDKAAMVYFGQGAVRWEEPSQDGGFIAKSESQLRVLSGHQFHATQSNLVETVAEFMTSRTVDYVHVETKSAFRAVAEMFKNQYGLDVIQHDPMQANKGQRLKACAPMLEESNAAQGIHATVLFPGTPDGKGGWTIDPELEWLEKQILQFGAVSDDHGVDAVTQLVNYLAPELGVGAGIASAQVRAAQAEVSHFRSRMEQILAAAKQPKNEEDGEQQYLRTNWT